MILWGSVEYRHIKIGVEIDVVWEGEVNVPYLRDLVAGKEARLLLHENKRIKRPADDVAVRKKTSSVMIHIIDHYHYSSPAEQTLLHTCLKVPHSTLPVATPGKDVLITSTGGRCHGCNAFLGCSNTATAVVCVKDAALSDVQANDSAASCIGDNKVDSRERTDGCCNE